MAGNSFMVTVSAPKAPCAHTHSRVSSGSQGGSTAPPAGAGARALWRRHSHQVASTSTTISTPTLVAR